MKKVQFKHWSYALVRAHEGPHAAQVFLIGGFCRGLEKVVTRCQCARHELRDHFIHFEKRNPRYL